MAKINSKDVEMINHKLSINLPNHHILDYDMVTFKNGRGRYAPKTELLLVRGMEKNPQSGRISYTTFLIKRESLCSSIESLIKQ